MPERKPLVKMESLEARTLRASGSMWAAMDRGARNRGLEPAEFGRNCLLMGLMLTLNPQLMEAAVQVLASVRIADLEPLATFSVDPERHRRQHAGAAR
jgi:hypothetical protein